MVFNNPMKISKEKKEKISEQILSFLYLSSPKSLFTSHIAREVARDEEFIKTLLEGLKQNNLVVQIKINPKGVPYSQRIRWKLSDQVYNLYKSKQP